MRVAEPIDIDAETERELRALSKGRRVEARVQQRASVILLAAQGWQNKDIADEVKLDRRQVALWRKRFIEAGVPALLQDAPRSGRAPSVSAAVEWYIVRTTLNEQPAAGTPWSTRSLASHLDLSATTVRRVWQRNGIAPHAEDGVRARTRSAPGAQERFIDVAGLYLNLPERALVLCCSEPGAAHAGGREPAEGDADARQGTARLLAALKLLERHRGPVRQDPQRLQQWLRFLRMTERNTPEHLQLHLVVEGHASHQDPQVQAWLARHPRVFVHFPLAGASWLKRLKRNLGDICEHGISRDSFARLPKALRAIAQHIEAHPEQRPPFIWTASESRPIERVRFTQVGERA